MNHRTLAVLIFLVATIPARAQFPILFPIEPPGPFVREALAQPYGRMLTGEFAKAVMQSADAACLQSKALDAAKLADRGNELFQRYGTQSMETIIKNVDARKYEARIAEIAGPGAAVELLQLRNDPEVKRYLALERPARLAKVLDFVVENLERYALITRINLKRFSPISTGNIGLLLIDPIEESEEAIEKFVSASTSPQLKRFIELSELTSPAVTDAFDQQFALRLGPITFYSGVENDLAELCITKR